MKMLANEEYWELVHRFPLRPMRSERDLKQATAIIDERSPSHRQFLLYFRYKKRYIRMANVKTAVSLDETIFKEADAMAREMNLTRSRLFAQALEEYIKRHRARRVLEKLNEAYAEETGAAERSYMRKMRRKQRKLVDRW